MEALISQFTFLSDQALHDKSFDPSSIEDLMRLFELEAYNSWSKMVLESQKEEESAEIEVQEAEDYLNSVMASAMEEFRSFEEEMERLCEAEYGGLVAVAERARKMGKSMERAATLASNKYVEAAVKSATSSMRSAWKGLSSKPKKVHPS